MGVYVKILNLEESYIFKTFISFYVKILVHLTILAIKMTSRVSEMGNNHFCTKWGHMYWKKHRYIFLPEKYSKFPMGLHYIDKSFDISDILNPTWRFSGIDFGT